LAPSRADLQLERVVDRLRVLDPDGSRFASVLRDTLDQLLDGQRTGRYRETELRKTEKTHMSTLVEINLHRAFNFDDGTALDYRIAGIEVDCKFSRSLGDWEIPDEASGHLCLVVWADETSSQWSAGVVRIHEEDLIASANRERKRRLNDAALERIVWVHREAPLPENLLLHLPVPIRDAVFSRRSGQSRVNELFRRVQGRIISRTAVLTTAQQKDAPKRVRDARKHLRPEGIVILGHQGDHPRIAAALELPRPQKGEWVSVRIAEAAPGAPTSVVIDGRTYIVADRDSLIEAAPLLDAREEAAEDD
jgi:hypothetical protein